MLFELTEDVPDETEARLVAEWGDIAAVDGTQRYCMKSALPPSWIAVIADHKELIAALGPAAAIFFAELTKEAAKETWRSKGKIARALAHAAVWPLRRAASILAAARDSTPRGASVVLQIPVSEFAHVRAKLDASDVEPLALSIAQVVRAAAELDRVVREIENGDLAAGGRYFATLEPDGTIRLEWISGRPLGRHARSVGDPMG